MELALHITPSWDAAAGTVDALGIDWEAGISARAGERLAAWITELVGVPFSPMEGLHVSDAAGEVPCSFEDGEPEMSFVKRRFIVAGRSTEGPVRVTYRVLPRVQPEGYHSSPYYDLVAEEGGVNGAGTCFLVHPARWEDAFDVELAWDLSGLPRGASAVWSFGSGERAAWTLTVQELLWSAFAVGMVRSSEGGRAGFYWFGEPPFDAGLVSRQVDVMFARMAEMFHDDGRPYRVFARHNAFPGGGGTALTRSYIYGYGRDDPVDADELRDLLAHEMVHNWPTMRDEPPGLGTWYVEGSAEYYSIIVPMELGLCSPEHTAEAICRKAGSYFSNPMNGLSNEELGRLYWEDNRCQRVPYARGVLFLSNIDARISRATGGARSLLDVEVALLEVAEPVPGDFIRAVREVSGLDVSEDYELMRAGGVSAPLVPDPDAFGGRFEVAPCRVQLDDARHSNEKVLLDEWAQGYEWRPRA